MVFKHWMDVPVGARLHCDDGTVYTVMEKSREAGLFVLWGKKVERSTWWIPPQHHLKNVQLPAYEEDIEE